MRPSGEIRALLDDAERDEARREVARLRRRKPKPNSKDADRLAGLEYLVQAYDAVRKDYPTDREELRRAFEIVDRELRRLDVDMLFFSDVDGEQLAGLRTRLRADTGHEHGEGRTAYEAFCDLEQSALSERGPSAGRGTPAEAKWKAERQGEVLDQTRKGAAKRGIARATTKANAKRETDARHAARSAPKKSKASAQRR